MSERTSTPGVVTGLAWTADGAGGLLFIEASIMAGKGGLHLTGQLGSVIQESAQLALTWVKTNSKYLTLSPEIRGDISESTSGSNFLKDMDVHIHFPAGAIPKDGPSAGVTIVSALVSLFTNQVVKPHMAMTGEITLSGQVLPVGGIKEKILAAHRGGVKTVILPERNRKDLEDVPKKVRDAMELILVKRVWDVLEHAFAGIQIKRGAILGATSSAAKL